jgi:hypothetical protein
MADTAKFDPGLSRIMVICLSMAFTVLIGSMEALRVTAAGFAFSVTWRTAVVMAVGAIVVTSCFYTLVYNGTKATRRTATAIIVSIGVAGFFYPLRFVPHEQMRAIFGGLILAVCALGLVATFIYLLHRFLSSEEEDAQ